MARLRASAFARVSEQTSALTRARLRVWQRAVLVRERTLSRTRADTVFEYWLFGGLPPCHQVAKARSAAGEPWMTSTWTPAGTRMIND